ncbi:hypothetical protein NC796_09105 [Aliifodinibius sp. S!AR15-10]|uniref:fumarate reductase subunit C n=1 Tax=Aliifodinibius sp. S!AR15-10 TaxID=2950437 RepID=UPI00285BA674|nr:hypothetical protein [Aliifodinibius sp. S!AR15-10]
MPIFWWIRKVSYVRFITRELTSLGVLAYALILLALLRSLYRGPEAYEAFLGWLASPACIVLHIVLLGIVLFHSITWFNLAPSALVLKIGKFRIPDRVIITGNIVVWAILSLAIAWIILSI